MSDTLQMRLRNRARYHDYGGVDRNLMLEAAETLDSTTVAVQTLEERPPEITPPALEPMSREHLIESLRHHNLDGVFKVPWVKKKLGL